MKTRASLWALGALALLPSVGRAQADVEELGRLRGATPPPSYYATLRQNPSFFTFSPENGWKQRARAVAERRRQWRSSAAANLLLAPYAPTSADAVLQGVLHFPSFLVLYANTDSAALVTTMSRDVMETRLFGTQPAPPYSLHSYYDEVSNGRLAVNGTVFEWTRVTGDDTVYEGPPGCYGLGSCGAVPGLIAQIVQLHDASVDFGQFDNDGPDGMPNSGDDDGFVDGVVLMHPELDGSCNQRNPEAVNNVWAHKSSVNVTTDDDAAVSGKIRVRDYIIQGGQGGDGPPIAACESNQPQSFGLVAHEVGHLLNLPDLYDTGGGTQGIGRWGIMGKGNQQLPFRPVHMMAWSQAELGWVTEVIMGVDTTIDISPVETSDTAYVVPVASSNQYFLLENRQRIGSDSTLIEPGLLIWHIDSVLTRIRGLPINIVNNFAPNGVALEQADGQNHLQTVGLDNRGDPGDPFPGSTGNTEFGIATTPSSARNDGSLTFLTVDLIAQLAPFGSVRARIALNPPALVVTSDDPPPGVMGASYEHSFIATGGIGAYDWSVTTGSLPDGLTLDVSGELSGRPESPGTFTFDASVRSGMQTVNQSIQIDVTVPVLEADEVVGQLLETSDVLSQDDLAYLDLLGNRNGQFDIGDFLAWAQDTGLEPAPAVARALTSRGRAARPREERR